jgi:hypothetical protein
MSCENDCGKVETCPDCGNSANLCQKQLGYFGNIWIVQNHFIKAKNVLGGHEHYFDHISLLAKGKVRVEVEDAPAKEFTAPTFIVIRKDKKHRVVSLEDDTVMFCVFAVPEKDAGSDQVFSDHHDPFGCAPDGYWENMRKLEEKTMITN